jgi:hypothetical protein
MPLEYDVTCAHVCGGGIVAVRRRSRPCARLHRQWRGAGCVPLQIVKDAF